MLQFRDKLNEMKTKNKILNNSPNTKSHVSLGWKNSLKWYSRSFWHVARESHVPRLAGMVCTSGYT